MGKVMPEVNSGDSHQTSKREAGFLRQLLALAVVNEADPSACTTGRHNVPLCCQLSLSFCTELLGELIQQML